MSKILETNFEGLFIIEPNVYEDSRGYFFESYNIKEFEQAGLFFNFVQDNQSMSNKNVLRGLHFQNPPSAQIKLVRVIKGAVLDVVVDIRKNSKTYGQNLVIELNEKNKTMLYIPHGFAHGFLTLEDNTIFYYKCSDFYSQKDEGSILWNDKDLNVPWNIDNPILSDKDKTAINFENFVTLF